MGAQTDQRIAALAAEVTELRQAVTFTTADVEQIKRHLAAQDTVDKLLAARGLLDEAPGTPQPAGGRRGHLRVVNGGRQ